MLMSMFLAACSGSADPAPIPDPTSSPSEPAVSPTDNEPSWEDDYTDKQLATYQDALARWTEYETKSEDIYATGKATAQAEALFKEYYPSPIWQSKFQVLQGYEQVRARSEGLPIVHWSKATSITKTSTTIRQCVDYSPVKRTQAGEPVDRPDPKPQLRDIHLSKPAGYDWLIYQETSRFKGEIRSCTH